MNLSISNSKFVALFAVLVIGFYALVPMPVILADPFQNFSAANENESCVLWPKNRRLLLPILAKYETYSTAIVGTSMVEKLPLDEASDLLSQNVTLLSLPGAQISEQAALVDLAAGRLETKEIIWVLDIFAMQQHTETDGQSTFPAYLYDYSVTNDLSYLLNKQAWQLSWEKAFGCDLSIERLSSPLEFTEVSATYLSDFSAARMKEAWTSPSATHNLLQSYKKRQPENSIKNWEEYVIPRVNKYKDIKFTIVLPPYPQMSYRHLWLNRPELINSIDELKIEMLNTTQALKNIKIHDFNNWEEVVSTASNFKDFYHYKPEINTEILKLVLSEEKKLNNITVTKPMPNLVELASSAWNEAAYFKY